MSKFILILFLPMVLSVSYTPSTYKVSSIKKSNKKINKFDTMEALHTQRINSNIFINIFTSYKPTCSCDSKAHEKKPKRDDYQYTPGIGAHKLHTVAANFHNARKTCYKEGGHLAVINSREEEMVMLDLFNRSADIKNASYGFNDQALIGVHSLFEVGEWLTILGDPLSSIGYINWSQTWWNTTQPDSIYVQRCCSLLRQGGMDNVSCNNWKFAFFCELPEA